jgi:hypothetical protein
MTPQQLQESIKLFEQGCEAKEAKDLLTASDKFTAAIELAPHVPQYHINLAIVACEQAKERDHLINKSFFHAQTAARLNPDDFATWVIFAEITLNCNKFPEAIAAYEKAIDMQPQHAFLWALLGFAYRRNGQIPQMRMACEKAIELDPEMGMPHFLLSCYFQEDEFNPERIAYHGEQGFSVSKPSVLKLESMWNAAHGFLVIGNYKKGWNYLESRLRPNLTNVGQKLPLSRFDKPLWRGDRDIRLVVNHEMGLGDSFVMMRYLPLIKEKFNCDVTFECQPGMLTLCEKNLPGIKCVPWDKVDPDTVDMQLPILSLPFVFNTKSYSVPWEKPYIRPDLERVAEWAAKGIRNPDVLNVAICWNAGRNSHVADNHSTSKRKSLTMEQIKPILDIPGINFISLQTTAMESFPNPGIRDFCDTAALIAMADIVISVDTAVANLAGAMGAELWLLDRFDHDWRWSDIQTPWFPTAKIYRQPKPWDWESVVARVVGDILQRRGTIRA